MSFKKRSFSNIVRVSTFCFLVFEFQPPYCLQAASWRENSIKINSFQEHNSTRMTQPRKSLSTSDLFNKTNQANLSALQTQYSEPTYQPYTQNSNPYSRNSFLQICNSTVDSGSFTLSELDHVKEVLEVSDESV